LAVNGGVDRCIEDLLNKHDDAINEATIGFNKSVPKPTNLRPGYEMEYIKNYYACIGYSTPFDFEKTLEAEKY